MGKINLDSFKMKNGRFDTISQNAILDIERIKLVDLKNDFIDFDNVTEQIKSIELQEGQCLKVKIAIDLAIVNHILDTDPSINKAKELIKKNNHLGV